MVGASRNYSTCSLPVAGNKAARVNLFLCFDGPLQGNDLAASDVQLCAMVKSKVLLRETSSGSIRGHLLHVT